MFCSIYSKNTDLSAYMTAEEVKNYVDGAILGAVTNSDPSAYMTAVEVKSYVASAVASSVKYPDLSAYMTTIDVKNYVDSAVAGSVANPDLTAYMTAVEVKNYVDSAIAGSVKNPDLTAYMTAEEVKNHIDGLFTGSVAAFAMELPPEGWLECNGQAISRETYSRLFSKIGTTFGQGDGTLTFNVPDLRGEFIRGWDHNRGVDAQRQIGSFQGDQAQSHVHSVAPHSHQLTDVVQNTWGRYGVPLSGSGGLGLTWPGYNGSPHPISAPGSVDIGDPIDYHSKQPVRHGSENRSRNVALLYCIKS